jgi:predicted dienelactone hydrolase
MKAIFCYFLLIICWLLPSPVLAKEKRSFLPSPTGPYAIGSFEADWQHMFAVESKRLKAQVWYPKQKPEEHIAPLSYFPYRGSEKANDIEKMLGMPADILLNLKDMKTHSYADGVAIKGEKFPLVIFNHGYWFYASQNTVLMEELASRGYIVVSVTHIGDSMRVDFADGSHSNTISYSPEPQREDKQTSAENTFWGAATHEERVAAHPEFHKELEGQRILASLETWQQELTAVLDDLEKGNVPKKLAALMKSADFSKVAFTGMSFGGAVAASACDKDIRCDAAVNLDGFQFGDNLFNKKIRTPFLMVNYDWMTYPLSGRFISWDFTANDYFYEPFHDAGNVADVYRIKVRLLKHMGFTDLPLFATPEINAPIVGALEGRLAVESVTMMVSAFLDRYLKAKEGSFPGTIFSKYPGLVNRTATSVKAWQDSLN